MWDSANKFSTALTVHNLYSIAIECTSVKNGALFKGIGGYFGHSLGQLNKTGNKYKN